MLTFTAQQFAQIEQRSARAFIERVVVLMRAGFPEQLDRQPQFVRMTMVGNGLQAADGYGFTLENTLGGFVALQFETSADFHVLPQAQDILLSAAPEQVRFERLTREIQQATWDTIKRGADMRAWFEPWRAEQQPARTAQRVCHAFPALVAVHAEDALLAFFRQAAPRARRHGIDAEVGIVVYAAALAVYGTRLDEGGGPAWAAEIFTRPPLPPEKIVALLRLRLLEDTDQLL